MQPKELQGRGVWRYRPFLPSLEPMTLGEGGTPLVPSLRLGPKLGITLWFKLEGGNPTGSFKDRGAAVLVSVLASFGVEGVVDDSSGNAGAALSAYAARAGLKAKIFIPAHASGPKLAQIQAYGAEVIRVSGPRERATDAARTTCQEENLAYASHNESPYFIAGLKTLAYEIAEELSWRVPDHVVVPLGGGGLFLGIIQGFSELCSLGWIGRMPKIHVVQAEACAPIVQAEVTGQNEPAKIDPGETIAEGICISQPARGREILAAVRTYGGKAVAVSEQDILTFQRKLAQIEGLYVEPTSAVAVAALSTLIAHGHIRPGEEVVIPLTGIGLKAGL